MPADQPVRRANEGLGQPNLNMPIGNRNLIQLQLPSPENVRDNDYVFVNRYPTVERINAFGDPYLVDGVQLTWLDTVLFERMLYRDPELQELGRRLANSDVWPEKLTRAAEEAAQRVFEEEYLPWLIEKFSGDVRRVCAEYALISARQAASDKQEADEWRKQRGGKRAVPGADPGSRRRTRKTR